MIRLGRIPLSPLVGVVVLFAVACGDEAGVTGPDPITLSEIRVYSGGYQSGMVGAFLDSNIVFEVIGSHGERINATVFVSLMTEGLIRTPNVTSNSIGPSIGFGSTTTATVEWQLGPRAGRNEVKATAILANRTSTDPVEARVYAFADPGELNHVVQIGNNQTGPAGVALPLPIGLALSDRYGNAIDDVLITWSVVGGGGSLPTDTTRTDVSGRADLVWTLGSTVGQQSVLAEIEGGTSVTFTATAN